MDYQVTEAFSRRITGTFGVAGVEWLERLPHLLETATDRWLLRLLPPFKPLSYHYVAPAIATDGTPVVLKAGVPHREFTTGIHALRHFGEQGAVLLLEADAETGLILMERLQPGRPLKCMQDDDAATHRFAGVCRRLRRPPPDSHSFPSVADWAKGFERLRNRFDGNTGPFPEPVIAHAENLLSELLNSMSESVVLHGDLHHWNILSAEREPWLAVDAKGVVGEPEYEVGAWLRNPFPQILSDPLPKKTMSRRVDILVEELGFDRERLLGWASAQAVLAGVWSYEDAQDDWDGWLACARVFDALL